MLPNDGVLGSMTPALVEPHFFATSSHIQNSNPNLSDQALITRNGDNS